MSTNAEQQLTKKYNQLVNTKSDINEHLNCLYNLAFQCESVLELGVRSAVSSWAFVRGLYQAKKKAQDGKFQPKLVGCDLEFHPNIKQIQVTAKSVGISYTFIKGNDLDIEVPDKQYDMIFIDTLHVYGQLKRELAKYAPLAKKWIVMHDTTIDGYTSEMIRLWSNKQIENFEQKTGWPQSELLIGLWPCVVEFLQENGKQWQLLKRYTHNNGLTILKRIE